VTVFWGEGVTLGPYGSRDCLSASGALTWSQFASERIQNRCSRKAIHVFSCSETVGGYDADDCFEPTLEAFSAAFTQRCDALRRTPDTEGRARG
jgi:hypothetical protein